MSRSKLYLATALVTLAACVDAPDDPPAGPAGGKADGALTRMTFADDWSETADGPLVAGLPVRIAYDLDRLTTCRASTNGSEVWGITGFASFDGGEPRSFAVTRLDGGRVVAVEAELAIPARAESVAIWFQTSNRFGCVAYDSNDNANYGFAIEQRAGVAIASFAADYSEDLPARLQAGDQLVVHYEPERLADCAGSTGGNPAWAVTMSYQIDGGAVKQLLVTRAEGIGLVPSDPELTVSRGRELAVWFEATNRWGCHIYDSNLGANYRLRIE